MSPKSVLGYLSITALLFWPTLFGSVLVHRDLMTMCFPFHWLAAKIWINFELPVWNSAAAAGMPLLGDPLAGALDPFLPIFMLPVTAYSAGTFYIVVKFFFAGICMQRYLRLIGLGNDAAFLGGAVYMLSGFTVGSWPGLNWISAAMFLPLVLAIPHQTGGILGRGLSAAVVLSLALWSGAFEATIAMIVFWITENLTFRQKGRGAELLLGLVGFVAFSLVQIFPTFEMLGFSSRAGGLNLDETLSYSVSPFELIGLAAPLNLLEVPSFPGLFPYGAPIFFGTYTGAAAIFLSLISKGQKRFTLLAIAGITLSLGRFLPGLPAVLELFPSLAIVRYPVKFLVFVPAAIAVLSAAGFSRLGEISGTEFKRAMILSICLPAVVVLAGRHFSDAALWNYYAPQVQNAILYAIVILLTAGLFVFGRFSNISMMILVIADLFFPATASIFFEPAAINRPPVLREAMSEPWPRVISDAARQSTPGLSFTQHRHEFMVTHSGVPWDVRHPDEYTSFHLKSFDDWWIPIVMQNGSLKKLGAVGISHYICDEHLAPHARKDGWVEVANTEHIFLFKNPHLLDEVRYYVGEIDYLSPGVDAVRSRRHRLSGNLDAEVDAPAPGWLYRAETFQQGWKAYVNGTAAEVFPATNFLGQLVKISEPGRAHVEFRYEPPLFYIGLIASFAAVILSLTAGTFLHLSSSVKIDQ